MPRKTIFSVGFVVLGLALVLLVLMFVMPLMMKPANTSPPMIAQVPPNGDLSVVAEVVEINGDRIRLSRIVVLAGYVRGP